MPYDRNDDSPNGLPSVSTSLLVRVQAMEPDAWARLVAVFSPIVYRWARQANLNGDDAADVVQDVFAAVARRIENFERKKESASFRSWLATIARNRIRDFFRNQQKHPQGLGGTVAMERFQAIPESLTPETEDVLDASISVEDLNESVPKRVLDLVRRECEEKTWRAFWSTTVEGDSAGDVADRLGMNIAGVYQAKTRILRRIRQRLDELP